MPVKITSLWPLSGEEDDGEEEDEEEEACGGRRWVTGPRWMLLMAAISAVNTDPATSAPADPQGTC